MTGQAVEERCEVAPEKLSCMDDMVIHADGALRMTWRMYVRMCVFFSSCSFGFHLDKRRFLGLRGLCASGSFDSDIFRGSESGSLFSALRIACLLGFGKYSLMSVQTP